MSTEAARALHDLPPQFNAAADLLDHNLAAGRGAKPAVIDHAGTTSYAALAERVDRMAGAFARLGIRREQRVLLCLLDTVDFPTVFLGAIKAGIVPVPLNTMLAAEDYRWLLDDSRAASVFVSAELAPRWSEDARDNPGVAFVSSGGGPWMSLEALIGEAPPMREAADTHRDEVAFWLYTSGSTGRPKGAMHLHAAMRLTANLFGQGVVGYRADDVVLSVAKQFFAYGLGNALTFPLAAGATAVLHKERATPEAIGALIRQHGVTLLNAVPTFFSRFLTEESAPTLRLATSAGESLPAHLGEAFRARFGVDIVDGLGSTEMLHVYLSQRPGEVRYGSTGRPVPGYEVRVVDEAGHPVPAGELGELQVRGPTAAIGYWRNRPKSLATFAGEWTRTGDKYRCDESGWYHYHGRADDMFKVNGIYVSPVEVEDALASHPAVLEAAVTGACDADGLVKPRAHVVLQPGHEGDESAERALRDHARTRLPPFKCPRWIVFTDSLPKTATGKLQRFRLREGS
jgi:benzoate-CoA ligase